MARKETVKQKDPRKAKTLAVAFLALILGASLLPRASGAIPPLLALWQRRLAGEGAVAIPLVLFLLAIFLWQGRRLGARMGGLLVLTLGSLGLLHSIRGDDPFGGKGGGAIGWATLWALRRSMGEVSTWILLSLSLIIGFALLTGISWKGIAEISATGVKWVWRAFGVVGRGFVCGLARIRKRALCPRPLPRRPLVEEASPGKTLPSTQAGELVEEITAGPPRIRRPREPREPAQKEIKPPVSREGYQLPLLSLLNGPQVKGRERTDPVEVARALERTLESFGVEAKVIGFQQGPVVTRYEVQPAPGVKVQRITSLSSDIALSLAARSVRIEAPIPGKSAVGIEIPNERAMLVPIQEVLASEQFSKATSPLAVALGKDLAGTPVVMDLQEMPHLLIAGATGSGKSVLLNVIIASLLFRATPREVRLLLIDPKRVELAQYNGIPHLLAPVVTSPREAAGKLRWILGEMESRFARFAEAGVRNIHAYNHRFAKDPLPFIVILIDELADLMMVAPSDFEDIICRLAQMTRATGIHLVVATQRPSVDVITGLIKANIPSRIAFAVSSQVDSRTILDMPGAEKLLGRGDMLFLPIGASRPLRIQGSYISDEEIERLVQWWRDQGGPVFEPEVLEAGQGEETGEEDSLLEEAARIIVRAGYGSVSLLQRKMRIGYVRASRIMDQLEEKGIVGPAQGSNPREVLVGLDDLEHLFARKRRERSEM
ncbi:MAG: DNA translocase FtsK [Armatimonadota bacterium]|nr:DNA translocase FtsK [Armatimonadota bacterium]MDR5702458.1 DNA translocase FtsK [Armatimonadota bacterium]